MQFVDIDLARSSAGLRLVLIHDVPSPWSEAARWLVTLKGVPFTPVKFRVLDATVASWTGVHNAPVALFDAEPPVSHWSEILALAERLAPQVPLLPTDLSQRCEVYGTTHALLSPLGLCWQARLLVIETSLATGGGAGFPVPVARHLAAKYGHSPSAVQHAKAAAQQILIYLEQRLVAQIAKGQRYLVGSQLTALDVYCATALAALTPPPEELVPLQPRFRRMLESASAKIEWNIPGVLMDHRDFIYQQHLLPALRAA
jgi:glutathione S-transferase